MLESDADFRKKLETVDVEKIRDGSIADELDFVNHKVRVAHHLGSTRSTLHKRRSYNKALIIFIGRSGVSWMTSSGKSWSDCGTWR